MGTVQTKLRITFNFDLSLHSFQECEVVPLYDIFINNWHNLDRWTFSRENLSLILI